MNITDIINDKYWDCNVMIINSDTCDAFIIVESNAIDYEFVTVMLDHEKPLIKSHKENRSGYLSLYPEIFKI